MVTPFLDPNFGVGRNPGENAPCALGNAPVLVPAPAPSFAPAPALLKNFATVTPFLNKMIDVRVSVKNFAIVTPFLE